MNNDINKSSILAPLPMGEGLGERLRADFPILSREVYGKPLVYLDNGATTQKPRQVVNAITDEYYSVNANVHRGVHFLSQQATELHEASRETVRRFINARSTNEIVFTRGTTESIMAISTILVIEDDRFIGEMYVRSLKMAGYNVEWAVDGHDGLVMATNQHYDLILFLKNILVFLL